MSGIVVPRQLAGAVSALAIGTAAYGAFRGASEAVDDAQWAPPIVGAGSIFSLAAVACGGAQLGADYFAKGSSILSRSNLAGAAALAIGSAALVGMAVGGRDFD